MLFLMRSFTASILFIFFIYCLFFSSSIFFEYVSFGVLILAVYEWTSLIGIRHYFYKFIYIAFLFVILFFIVVCGIDFYLLLIINFILWFFGLFFIYFYSKYRFMYYNFFFGTFFGVVIFIPWWLSINYLNILSSYSKLDIVFICLLVFGADIFAYLFGKKWGNRKLLYIVSPGKTWMGVFGGVVSTIIIIIIFLMIFDVREYNIGVYLLYSFVILYLSIIGDLLESTFKRKMNFKDSGVLLPGHGGVLDRIDSLLAAIPVFIFLFKC